MASPEFNISQVRIERTAAWLFIIALVVVCLIYFATFFQPLVLAGMIWYFIYALRDYGRRVRIGQRRLPEWLLTTLAFVVIILIIYVVIEIVMRNLELIIGRLPEYLANYTVLLESLRTYEPFDEIQERLIHRLEEFDFRPLLTALLNGLSSLAGNIVMIIIYAGFLIAEQRTFRKKLTIIAQGSDRASAFFRILSKVNDAVRTYVIIKSQMSLLTGLVSYGILLAFGVDFPILWAFLIFLLNFIPYVGSVGATLLPAAFSVLQFQSFVVPLWILIIIASVQIVVVNIVEPRVMGRTLNLSPLGTLLALAFWGLIWGILGMIISVPVTSILVIIASHIPTMRFLAIWLSETGNLDVIREMGKQSESESENKVRVEAE
ncbi:MAG: AI-2E family transporter [Cyclobacteriaceae bacterium]|nr:AI-2E family transporter [Cyclobacteriaceae bacterium]